MVKFYKIINWDNVKEDFIPDGMLMDIYAFNITLNDRLKVIDFFKNSDKYKSELFLNNSETSIFENNIEKYLSEPDNYLCLKIYKNNIYINGHFYSTYNNELEFDIDPKEINDQQSLDIILEFIKDIGKITNKEIILTPESSRDIIILKYEPQNNIFTYIEPKV